jgi:hypothetical protein
MAATGRRLAPEVTAARVQSGVSGVSGVSEEAIGNVTLTELTGASLVDLVAQMRSAERVDIVGVLPRALGEALLAGEPTGTGDEGGDEAPPRPSESVYLTPSRERVAAYRHKDVMGRVVQRWSSGLSCFRNWTTRSMSKTDTAEIRLIDDLFLDCVVLCRWPGRDPEVWVLTLLPQSSRPPPRDTAVPEELITTQVQAASVQSVLERVDDLRATGPLLSDSGLVCGNAAPAPPPPRPAGHLPSEFAPIVVDFRPAWRTPIRPGTIVPVCIVALHSTTPRGPGLLLLHRNDFTARDDFDTLSLLSKRVTEEDFARAIAQRLPEPAGGEDRLDAWWLQLGKPHRMDVPREAFVAAGQREVFMQCGLDLPADRFAYTGSHLVEHEGNPYHLGFVTFRLDLVRNEDVDERAQAQRWNSDLVFVLGENLYRPRTSGPTAPLEERPLGRLLTKRPEWVVSTLVGEAGRAGTEADG